MRRGDEDQYPSHVPADESRAKVYEAGLNHHSDEVGTGMRGFGKPGKHAITKAFSMNFWKSMAKQFAPKGILVDGIAPTLVWTPLQVSGGATMETLQSFGGDTPMGQRAGLPNWHRSTCSAPIKRRAPSTVRPMVRQAVAPAVIEEAPLILLGATGHIYSRSLYQEATVTLEQYVSSLHRPATAPTWDLGAVDCDAQRRRLK
jgi:hypothetical protein